MSKVIGDMAEMLARPIFASMAIVYKFLFSGLEKRMAARDQQRLAQSIEDALGFLFTEHNGRLVQTLGAPFPPPMDDTYLTVALKGINIEFFTGRGDLQIGVAPSYEPTDRHDLSLLLAVVSGDGRLKRRRFEDLWEVRSALQPEVRAVAELLADPARFEKLKERLEEESTIRSVNRFENWKTESTSDSTTADQ